MTDIKEKAAAHVQRNNQGGEIQILTVAAFGFAVVSWIATAKGLNEQVFDGQPVLAALVSFGIQSILFVLNLKLPAYFERIGKLTPEEDRVKRVYHFGPRNGKEKASYRWTFYQWLTACFYALVLFASSFFSFVYIANYAYSGTRYLDANVAIQQAYREYLYETDQYIGELTKCEILTIGKQASLLDLNSDSNQKTKKEDLEDKKSNAEIVYNNAVDKVNIKSQIRDHAEAVYTEPMTVRWRGKKARADEKRDYETAENDLLTAKVEENAALIALNTAERELSEYVPPLSDFVHDLLAETLKPSPDPQGLQDAINGIADGVVKISEQGRVAGFTDAVSTTQKIMAAIDDYQTLEALQEADAEINIEGLKSEFLHEPVLVPVPDTAGFAHQKDLWETEWKGRFSSLETIVGRVPKFSQEAISEIEDVNAFVNTETLMRFDAERINRKIDRLVRRDLANINLIERACGLLVGNFPALARFSLLFALFLDSASLLAGLVIYFITRRRKRQ